MSKGIKLFWLLYLFFILEVIIAVTLSRLKISIKQKLPPKALTNFTSNRYSVPSGSRTDLHDETPRAEFTDGWMNGTGYQKCPSIFFILCRYIDHIYIYIYIYIIYIYIYIFIIYYFYHINTKSDISHLFSFYPPPPAKDQKIKKVINIVGFTKY